MGLEPEVLIQIQRVRRLVPSAVGGINQTRGFCSAIRDRWDLTLECIRRYYKGEDSPLKEVLDKNKARIPASLMCLTN